MFCYKFVASFYSEYIFIDSDKDTSGGGFSSLFHWGSGTSSTGRTLSSLVSSKAPPSATGGSGGMKFLQLKQVQAVPSANFRSYRWEGMACIIFNTVPVSWIEHSLRNFPLF